MIKVAWSMENNWTEVKGIAMTRVPVLVDLQGVMIT